MLKSNAFSMIEIIFVIVIMAILGVVIIVNLHTTRTDAIFSKARTQISAIRSAILLNQGANMISGDVSFPEALDDVAYNEEGESLFDGNTTSSKILQYPIYSKYKEGGWMKSGENTYGFFINGGDNTVMFIYNNEDGGFDCDHTYKYCKHLTQ